MSSRRVPDLSGFLGPGTRFEGEISFPDNLRIEGTFKGTIRSPDASLVVAEGARIDGEVEVGELFVAGRIDGTVKARHRFEVAATGEVRGSVHSPNLIVRDGAFLDAELFMDRTGESVAVAESRTEDDDKASSAPAKAGAEAKEEARDAPGQDAPTTAPAAGADTKNSNDPGSSNKSADWREPGWKGSKQSEEPKAKQRSKHA